MTITNTTPKAYYKLYYRVVDDDGIIVEEKHDDTWLNETGIDIRMDTMKHKYPNHEIHKYCEYHHENPNNSKSNMVIYVSNMIENMLLYIPNTHEWVDMRDIMKDIKNRSVTQMFNEPEKSELPFWQELARLINIYEVNYVYDEKDTIDWQVRVCDIYTEAYKQVFIK